MKTVFVLGLSLLLIGCIGIGLGTRQTGARTAIEVATLKFIDGDSQRARRFYEITDGLIAITSETETQSIKKTLDKIEAKARSRIEWSKLDEAEALLIHRLIDVVRIEIQERAKQGFVDESAQVAIRTVLKWVRNIAQLSGGGNGDQFETLGGNAIVGTGRARSA